MCFIKFRKFPIINFGKGIWGMDFWVNRKLPLSLNKAEIYGWCSQKDLMRRGTLLIKEFDKGIACCRIKSIEWMDDPTDMFFAKVKFINSARGLTLKEVEFIERFLPEYVIKEDEK